MKATFAKGDMVEARCFDGQYPILVRGHITLINGLYAEIGKSTIVHVSTLRKI